MKPSEVTPAGSRLAWLLGIQNADGGWGYRPGKASWLEPTVYAARALEAWPLVSRAREARAKAQRYIDGLQRAEGWWQASARLPEKHWSGALWLGLASAPRDRPARWCVGIRWLAAEQGAEGGWVSRMGAWLDPQAVEQDQRLRGWPWVAGSSSWVEPTCHAMLALRAAMDHLPAAEWAGRLDEGRRVLLDRRCEDGGWNYGNRRVRGHDLPGYPETTALALLTLQRCGAGELAASVARARSNWEWAGLPRLPRIWTALALRNLGLPVTLEDAPASGETITAALETVAWSAGGFA